MATGPELPEHLFRNFIMSLTGLASEIATATASAGAATVNDYMGLVTTEALTTAQAAIYTLTLTNHKVAAGDLVFAVVFDGTNTQGTPVLGQVKPGASSVTIKVINQHASAQALNGTLKIGFLVVKAL